MATESKSKYFHSLGELQADQEMEQALKDDDGSDWKKKQEEIEQAFKVLSDREEQKKKLKERKNMSDGFRPKEPNAFVDAPHYDDPRLEKPALQLPAFDKPQDYSIGKVPDKMDVDAPNSFLLAGIHEWTKDGIEAGKQIGEVIAKEAKELEDSLPNKTADYLEAVKMFVPHVLRHQISTSLSQAPQPEITEKDFREKDLKILKEVLSRPHLISPKPDNMPKDNDEIREWKKQGYKYIKLQDQPKRGTSVDDKDRELPKSLTATIGGMWYKQNEDGTINIRDRYDFDPKDLSFPNIAGVALGAQETPGKISTGNPVNITLR